MSVYWYAVNDARKEYVFVMGSRVRPPKYEAGLVLTAFKSAPPWVYHPNEYRILGDDWGLRNAAENTIASYRDIGVYDSTNRLLGYKVNL
jgi:hypothetical protein